MMYDNQLINAFFGGAIIFAIYILFFYNRTKYVKKQIDYNGKTKAELISHLRSNNKAIQLNNESPNYSSVIESFEPKSKNLIALCFELYDALKSKVSSKPREKLTEEIKTKRSMKKKTFYNIKPTELCIQEFNDSTVVVNKKIILFLLPIPKLTNPTTQMQDGVITEAEYKTSFKDIDVDKIDAFGINERLMQNLNDMTIQVIINIYNEMYSQNSNSRHIEIASFGRLCFAYKIGKADSSKDKLNSFRQIMCIPKIVSIFHRILANRLVAYFAANKYIDTTIQKGVMPGSKFGIPEHIYKIKSVFRSAYKHKCPAFVLFIDITNAFGSLHLEQLYSVLQKYNVPDKFIDYIKKYYKSFEYYAEIDKTDNHLRKWNTGLIQGSPLSPILFVSVMNFVLSHLNDKFRDTHGYKINSKRKNLFAAYIDDICITCDTYQHLHEVYTELKKTFVELGFEINNSKSGFMTINDPDKISNLDGIKKVDEYKYLGEYVADNASPDIACEKFIREMYGKLKRLDEKDVNLTVKASVFTKCFWPWIQRKGIALYDIGTPNKNRIIQDITKFTNKWNVATVIDVDTVFRNIKTLLGDSTDLVVNDIIGEDDSEYIQGTNELCTKFLFRKSTHLTNFVYDNINDPEIIDDALNGIPDPTPEIDVLVKQVNHT